MEGSRGKKDEAYHVINDFLMSGIKLLFIYVKQYILSSDVLLITLQSNVSI